MGSSKGMKLAGVGSGPNTETSSRFTVTDLQRRAAPSPPHTIPMEIACYPVLPSNADIAVYATPQRWSEPVPYLKACELSRATRIYEPLRLRAFNPSAPTGSFYSADLTTAAAVPLPGSLLGDSSGSLGLAVPPLPNILVQCEEGPYSEHWNPHTAAERDDCPFPLRATGGGASSPRQRSLVLPEPVDWDEAVVRAATSATAQQIALGHGGRGVAASLPSLLDSRLAPGAVEAGGTSLLQTPMGSDLGAAPPAGSTMTSRRRDVGPKEKFLLRSQRRQEASLLGDDTRSTATGGGGAATGAGGGSMPMPAPTPTASMLGRATQPSGQLPPSTTSGGSQRGGSRISSMPPPQRVVAVPQLQTEPTPPVPAGGGGTAIRGESAVAASSVVYTSGAPPYAANQRSPSVPSSFPASGPSPAAPLTTPPPPSIVPAVSSFAAPTGSGGGMALALRMRMKQLMQRNVRGGGANVIAGVTPTIGSLRPTPVVSPTNCRSSSVGGTEDPEGALTHLTSSGAGAAPAVPSPASCLSSDPHSTPAHGYDGAAVGPNNNNNTNSNPRPSESNASSNKPNTLSSPPPLIAPSRSAVSDPAVPPGLPIGGSVSHASTVVAAAEPLPAVTTGVSDPFAVEADDIQPPTSCQHTDPTGVEEKRERAAAGRTRSTPRRGSKRSTPTRLPAGQEEERARKDRERAENTTSGEVALPPDNNLLLSRDVTSKGEPHVFHFISACTNTCDAANKQAELPPDSNDETSNIKHQTTSNNRKIYIYIYIYPNSYEFID
eukprot:gene1520-905_t